MKKFFSRTILVVAAFLPVSSASAQIALRPDGGPLQDLLINITIFINNVVIPFILAIGFLFFVWGMFLYFIMGGANDEKRAAGRSYMVHSILGFVMIIIFFGVVNLIADSIGLNGQSIDSVPTVDVP